jgi:hypothetical protein
MGGSDGGRIPGDMDDCFMKTWSQLSLYLIEEMVHTFDHHLQIWMIDCFDCNGKKQ